MKHKFNETADETIDVGAQQHVNANGETDAEEAAKLGGIGGAVTGAIAGAMVGPGGAILGAVIGGAAGAVASGLAVAQVDKIDNDNEPLAVDPKSFEHDNSSGTEVG